jgi:hypothetical protein
VKSDLKVILTEQYNRVPLEIWGDPMEHNGYVAANDGLNNDDSIWSAIGDYISGISEKTSSVAHNAPKLITIHALNAVYAVRYFKYALLVFFAYLLVGICYWCGHLKYHFLDALYYIFVTFFTIG